MRWAASTLWCRARRESGPSGRLRPVLIALAVAVAAGAGASSAGADLSASVDFQADAGHTGRLWGAGVVPPLSSAWTMPVAANPIAPSYPVIGGGRAYVVDRTENQLVAVDLGTGSVAWRAPLLLQRVPTSPYLAYDDGRVFAVGDETYPAGSDNDSSAAEGFDATTGAELWNSPTLGADASEPVVSNGTLYFDTTDDGGNRAAIRDSDGKVLWDESNGHFVSAAEGTYDGGPLTLTAAGLIGFDGCGSGLDTDPATGVPAWVRGGDCYLPESQTGVTAGSYAWFGEPDASLPTTMADSYQNETDVALDPATGQDVGGRFPSGTSPVFADGLGIQTREVTTPTAQGDAVGGYLTAFDPATNQERWRFTDGGLDDVYTWPLAADGYVYAASVTGTVWSLDPLTGRVIWTGHAPAGTWVDWLGGLAAGDGYLVLVTDAGLVAFHGSTPAAPPPAAWTREPGAPSLAPFNITPPTISGHPTQDQKLTAAGDVWGNTPTSVSYTWERCDAEGRGCAPIDGISGSTYTLTSADAGHRLKTQAVASTAAGTSLPAPSSATSVVAPLPPVNQTAPTISDRPAVGQPSTEQPGTWTNDPSSLAVQWKVCDADGTSCTAITGATGPTFTPTNDDLGDTLRVTVTAANSAGPGAAATSPASAAITAPDLPKSGATSTAGAPAGTPDGTGPPPTPSGTTTGTGPSARGLRGELASELPSVLRVGGRRWVGLRLRLSWSGTVAIRFTRRDARRRTVTVASGTRELRAGTAILIRLRVANATRSHPQAELPVTLHLRLLFTPTGKPALVVTRTLTLTR